MTIPRVKEQLRKLIFASSKIQKYTAEESSRGVIAF